MVLFLKAKQEAVLDKNRWQISVRQSKGLSSCRVPLLNAGVMLLSRVLREACQRTNTALAGGGGGGGGGEGGEAGKVVQADYHNIYGSTLSQAKS